MKSAMAMLCRNFSVAKSADAKSVDEHFGFLMAPKNLSVTFQKRTQIACQDKEKAEALGICPVAAVGV